MLAERRHGWRTLRLWAIVLPSNVAGRISVRIAGGAHRRASPGVRCCHDPPWARGCRRSDQPRVLEWRHRRLDHRAGRVAGERSHSITGSVMLIWLLTFVVGLGGFAHCIATSGEILAAILDHQLALSRYFAWLAPGNAGQYLRWRAAGYAARVWPGERRRGRGLLSLERLLACTRDDKT